MVAANGPAMIVALIMASVTVDAHTDSDPANMNTDHGGVCCTDT